MNLTESPSKAASCQGEVGEQPGIAPTTRRKVAHAADIVWRNL